VEAEFSGTGRSEGVERVQLAEDGVEWHCNELPGRLLGGGGAGLLVSLDA
jgi:hypothetical protein